MIIDDLLRLSLAEIWFHRALLCPRCPKALAEKLEVKHDN